MTRHNYSNYLIVNEYHVSVIPSSMFVVYSQKKHILVHVQGYEVECVNFRFVNLDYTS